MGTKHSWCSKMAQTLAPYLNCVRHTLTAAICLQNFGSQLVERHNKPEVEAKDHLYPDGKPKMTSRELMLHSVVIARNKQERVLIEGSINSVRVSIGVKQADELEVVLCRPSCASSVSAPNSLLFCVARLSRATTFRSSSPTRTSSTCTSTRSSTLSFSSWSRLTLRFRSQSSPSTLARVTVQRCSWKRPRDRARTKHKTKEGIDTAHNFVSRTKLNSI